MAETPNGKQPRYTVIIQWDDESGCYVVSLPEWGPYCKAYGATYEKAARSAAEVLELLMEDENGQPTKLPEPQLFRYPGAIAVNLPEEPERVSAAPAHTKQSA